MNENKITLNEKKSVFLISEIVNQRIKIRHVCDQSIARCNKNTTAYLLDNKIERQETIEGKHTQGIAKVRTLRK